MPLLDRPKWANEWLVEKFARWLDGGEPMETNVEDNLQSMALIFAAVQSSQTGKPVQVQRFLEKARATIQSVRMSSLGGVVPIVQLANEPKGSAGMLLAAHGVTRGKSPSQWNRVHIRIKMKELMR